jgi:hypothetical protein
MCYDADAGLLVQFLSRLQSAFFNFQSLLTVVLLMICLCTYIHTYAPSWLDAHKKGSVETTRRWEGGAAT